MATKYWKVEISRLGASEPSFLGTVEAPTWPAALAAGRKQIGEEGGVPPGASCNVNPNGTVTIQDARGRVRYQLVPAKEPAAPPGTKAAADVVTLQKQMVAAGIDAALLKPPTVVANSAPANPQMRRLPGVSGARQSRRAPMRASFAVKPCSRVRYVSAFQAEICG